MTFPLLSLNHCVLKVGLFFMNQYSCFFTLLYFITYYDLVLIKLEFTIIGGVPPGKSSSRVFCQNAPLCLLFIAGPAPISQIWG